MFLGFQCTQGFTEVFHRSKVYYFRGQYKNNQTIFNFHFRRFFSQIFDMEEKNEPTTTSIGI